MNVKVIEVSADQLDAPWAMCANEDYLYFFVRKAAEVSLWEQMLRIA